MSYFVRRLVVTVLMLFSLVWSQSGLRPARSGCNLPAPEAITHVPLPGHPFGSAITKDGCWLFVSLVGGKQGRPPNGIAMLHRSEGRTELEKVFPTSERPTELVLTHDNTLLIAAAFSSVLFLDVGKMLAKDDKVIVGTINSGDDAGSIAVNVTADDKFLFVSEEQAESITVIDLQRARSEGSTTKAIVGKIPVAPGPIALVFSPDQKRLYLTSEVGPSQPGWPAGCKPEQPEDAPAGSLLPEGAVTVVDVERAKVHPEKSVTASVPAGCSPVRMVISADGRYLYVTARSSNAMLQLNTARLRHNSRSALVATVPVGDAPVPIALVDRGKKILVANSNRFAGKAEVQDVTVIDVSRTSSGARAVLGTIPAGTFPREFSQSPDGKTVFLSNFRSNTLEIIDVQRLPEKMTPSAGHASGAGQ